MEVNSPDTSLEDNQCLHYFIKPKSHKFKTVNTMMVVNSSSQVTGIHAYTHTHTRTHARTHAHTHTHTFAFYLRTGKQYVMLATFVNCDEIFNSASSIIIQRI